MANYELMYSPGQFTVFNSDGSAPIGLKQQEFAYNAPLTDLFFQLKPGDTVTYSIEGA